MLRLFKFEILELWRATLKTAAENLDEMHCARSFLPQSAKLCVIYIYTSLGCPKFFRTRYAFYHGFYIHSSLQIEILINIGHLHVSHASKTTLGALCRHCWFLCFSYNKPLTQSIMRVKSKTFDWMISWLSTDFKVIIERNILRK